MRKFGSILKSIRLIFLILLYFLYGQESLAQEVRSPVLKWSAELDFVAYTNSKFKGFKGFDQFAFSKTVSVTAIPLVKSPVNNIDELAPGKVIGALYLSTGSIRLNLSPGSYTISVAREDGQWKATFIDRTGSIVNTLPAKVEKASPVEFPLAYLDQSVCYRFDETLVCI